MAQPEEIARVVGFVAGEGASYFAATMIFADGGIMYNSVGLKRVSNRLPKMNRPPIYPAATVTVTPVAYAGGPGRVS
jgi:hypothetical protein